MIYAQDSGELEPKLQSLVTELSEGLGSLVRRNGGGNKRVGSASKSLAGKCKLADNCFAEISSIFKINYNI